MRFVLPQLDGPQIKHRILFGNKDPCLEASSSKLTTESTFGISNEECCFNRRMMKTDGKHELRPLYNRTYFYDREVSLKIIIIMYMSNIDSFTLFHRLRTVRNPYVSLNIYKFSLKLLIIHVASWWFKYILPCKDRVDWRAGCVYSIFHHTQLSLQTRLK